MDLYSSLMGPVPFVDYATYYLFQVSKQLGNISAMLFTGDNEQQSDVVLAQLSQEMYNSGLLLLLLRNFHRVDFEGRKDTAQIFNNVLRRQIGTRTPTVS